MKKKLWLVLAATVVLVGLIGAGCTSGSAGGDTGLLSNLTIPGNILQQNGIWVTGEGKVKAVPDTAVLSVGIEVQAATVSEAQQQAQAAMNGVIGALKEKGIEDKDIQTQQFSISPVVRYVDKENRTEIIAYQVTNMIIAKVRNLPDTGPVIDAVAVAGGNFTRINSVSFTIDDPSALQAQATELALGDAKAKAKLIADTLEITLGQVTYAQVSGAPIPYPVPVQFREFAGAPAMDTSISPGELTIQATVNVVWGID